MSNVLLIHAGIPKTGTTTLQYLLYENQDKLDQYGWCYPDLQKELFDIPVWTEDFVKNGVFYEEIRELRDGIVYRKNGDLNIETEEWNKIWEQILLHLENRNVILSEESLWFDIDRFLTGAKQKYDNIKVIVYLRRQDRAVESWWNQSVKGRGHCDKTLKEFIDSSPRMKRMDGFHYLKKLDQISAIIGQQNVIVRVFERQQFAGEFGLKSDFFSILGIEPDWEEWNNFCEPNAGISGNYLEIKRIFNSIQPEEYLISGLGALEWDFVKLSQYFGAEGGIFTQKERIAFLEQFKSENEEIARKYLHREDGVLFYDEKTDIPQNNIGRHSLFEEDMIRTFSAMINVQNKELMRMKKDTFVLAERILLHKIGKRKVMLFGAGRKCTALLDCLQLSVAWIVDNDESKKGKSLKGIRIIGAEDVKDWSEYFVIITCIESESIENQLQMLNLVKEEDYVLAKEYFTCY